MLFQGTTPRPEVQGTISRASLRAMHGSIFTARRSYASAVLGVVICPSVRLSITRLLCYNKTKQRTAYILIPHEREITPVF